MVLFWDRYAQRENRAFATAAEREGQTEQQHPSRLCYLLRFPSLSRWTKNLDRRLLCTGYLLLVSRRETETNP